MGQFFPFALCLDSEISQSLIFAQSLSFCSRVNVWKEIIPKRKAEEKQTMGMRSRRKPVKPGEPGQLSQIHITKRGYKSSWGGVSVDPEKINPSLTIQGHQHGTHGGPAWVTTTSNRDKIYIHHSRADTVCLTWRNTICPYSFAFAHISKCTLTHKLHLLALTPLNRDVSEYKVSRSYSMFSNVTCNNSLARRYFSVVYQGYRHTSCYTQPNK